MLAAVGCGESAAAQGDEPQSPLTRRTSNAVFESCTLTPDVILTLGDESAKRVFGGVVLSCLRADSRGELTPVDSDPSGVANSVTSLRGFGYRAELGILLADASGTRPTPDEASAWLNDPTFRTNVVAAAASYDADGWSIIPPQVAASGRAGLTELVREFSSARAPGKSLSLEVPPSTDGDLAGGDAVDLAALSPLVDRMDVTTLDYSCCGNGPGPTLDANWAVDALHYARERAGSVRLTVSLPLYGVDFSSGGDTYICHDDALRTANREHVDVRRTEAGTPHFAYVASGVRHEVWFDDAVSLGRVLSSWEPPVLPSDVGLTWYSLGCEDTSVWARIAGALR